MSLASISWLCPPCITGKKEGISANHQLQIFDLRSAALVHGDQSAPRLERPCESWGREPSASVRLGPGLLWALPDRLVRRVGDKGNVGLAAHAPMARREGARAEGRCGGYCRTWVSALRVPVCSRSRKVVRFFGGLSCLLTSRYSTSIFRGTALVIPHYFTPLHISRLTCKSTLLKYL